MNYCLINKHPQPAQPAIEPEVLPGTAPTTTPHTEPDPNDPFNIPVPSVEPTPKA